MMPDISPANGLVEESAEKIGRGYDRAESCSVIMHELSNLLPL